MAGFEHIIGHKQVIHHLRGALETGKISHAYLFAGEKGSGKRTVAEAFAAVLQCENSQDRPCGVCHSCRQAAGGNHQDIITVTHEKPTSIGVEDVRELLLGLRMEGKTILLASHSREDIEILCDEVYEMEHGVIRKNIMA